MAQSQIRVEKAPVTTDVARLEVGRFVFRCILNQDAILPVYKGSTLRGVLGATLKKTVCALKKKECKECPLGARCLYARVFEPHFQGSQKGGSHLKTGPCVIEPPDDTGCHLPKGTPLSFSLILFGGTCAELPYFVHAIDTMGLMGIGKPIQGRRAGYSIQSIEHAGRFLYDLEKRELDGSNLGETIIIPDETLEPEPAGKIRLECLTPLRLKFDNHLQVNLPFHVLVRALLRRISSLFDTYGTGEPSLDYKGLVQRAMKVYCMENHLQWYDWKRFSRRQDREMLMGGIVGHAVYEGNLTEYMPLLRLGGLLHIGKQTSFGLGKIRTEVLA